MVVSPILTQGCGSCNPLFCGFSCFFAKKHPVCRSTRDGKSAPLETKNVELVAWLTELMHCAQPLVAHAGVRLTLRCSLTAHVAAIHPSYLERLLWNLLSNAVKYTPSGLYLLPVTRRNMI